MLTRWQAQNPADEKLESMTEVRAKENQLPNKENHLLAEEKKL
jgi:hypothetical protein